MEAKAVTPGATEQQTSTVSTQQTSTKVNLLF